MKEIELSQGKVALVDDADYGWLKQWRWHAAGNYAGRSVGKAKIFMHRLIMDITPGMEVHHLNGSGLDNRRTNLIEMTESEHGKLPHKTLKQGRKPKGHSTLR